MANRRNVLIGLGSVIAGGGALLGTGAFTTVTAERTVSVETAGDADALLQITANEDYGEDVGEYVSTTDDGTIQLTFDKVNRNAVTRFDELLQVGNQGTQEIDLYVHNGDGASEEDPIYGNGYGSSGPMDVLAGDNYASENNPTPNDSNSDSIVGGNENQIPRGSPLSLAPGDTALLTIIIDTRSTGTQSWENGEMEIIADSA